jgi:hypothetical protein
VNSEVRTFREFLVWHPWRNTLIAYTECAIEGFGYAWGKEFDRPYLVSIDILVATGFEVIGEV